MTFAGSPQHPCFVERAFSPSFDQLHQVQVCPCNLWVLHTQHCREVVFCSRLFYITSECVFSHGVRLCFNNDKTRLRIIWELWCSEPVAMVSTVIEHSVCFSVHVDVFLQNCPTVESPPPTEERWETEERSLEEEQLWTFHISAALWFYSVIDICNIRNKDSIKN